MTKSKSDAKRCGAKTRSGKPCSAWAMGNERCRMHGGKTPQGTASASFKHGRYSKSLPSRLADRYERLVADPELLSLASEIALIDTRLEELVERLGDEENVDRWAQLAAAWSAFIRARRAGDVPTMTAALAAIGEQIDAGAAEGATWAEIVELIGERRQTAFVEWKRLQALQQVITVEQALALVQAVMAAVHEHVTHRRALDAIGRELGALLVRDDARQLAER